MGKKQKIFDDVQVGDTIYQVKFWIVNPFEEKFIREIIPLTVTSIEKGYARTYEFFNVKTNGGYGYTPVWEKDNKNCKSKQLMFGDDFALIFDRDTVKELIDKAFAYHESELAKLKLTSFNIFGKSQEELDKEFNEEMRKKSLAYALYNKPLKVKFIEEDGNNSGGISEESD